MSRSPLSRTAVALATALLTFAACDRSPTAPQQQTTSGHRPLALVVAPGVAPMVSAGYNDSCALHTSGTVECWGANGYGQASPPAALAQSVTEVSAFIYHACAVKDDGTVACWGDADDGRATPPAGLAGVTHVAAGSNFSCALTAAGTVSCWGSNQWGQSAPPPGLAGVSQISAGYDFACAIASDGGVSCWGYDISGQASPPSLPAAAVKVSAGLSHACAVLANGTVSCWGYNEFHQTVPPADLTDAIDVAAGMYQSCALRSGGTVVCWGDVPLGMSPVPADLAGVVQLDANQYHTCAVKSDGTVACWGALSGVDVPAGLNLLAPQSITFTSAPPSPAIVGGSYALRATGGASGNPVTFSSLTPAVCTVSGNTTGLVATGTCTVAADQAGGGNFAPATRATQSFTVQPMVQAIAFTTAAPNPAYVGTSYTVRATGGASGNPVVFSTLTPAVCGASGDVVSLLAAGLCTVAANQAGGGSYSAAAPVTQSFLVSKIPQSITFTSTPPSPALVGASSATSATGGGSGNAVTFASLTPSVCVLSGATVSFVGVGTCTVAADQAGNAAYLAAPQAMQSAAVVYPFTGYDAFANLPSLDAVRAGSTISLDFSLGGDRGLNVLGVGSPTTVSLPNCGTTPSGLESPRTVTNRTLSYNKRTGNYTLSFSSDKAWLGTCRQLVMRLADGTEHRANYQFSR